MFYHKRHCAGYGCRVKLFLCFFIFYFPLAEQALCTRFPFTLSGTGGESSIHPQASTGLLKCTGHLLHPIGHRRGRYFGFQLTLTASPRRRVCWQVCLRKNLLCIPLRDIETYFDIPLLSKRFGFKVFGVGHGGDVTLSSGGEDHKKAVFFCIFGRTSRFFILGFTEKSHTAVENLVSMF